MSTEKLVKGLINERWWLVYQKSQLEKGLKFGHSRRAAVTKGLLYGTAVAVSEIIEPGLSIIPLIPILSYESISVILPKTLLWFADKSLAKNDQKLKQLGR